jgi:hypothetical protein
VAGYTKTITGLEVRWNIIFQMIPLGMALFMIVMMIVVILLLYYHHLRSRFVQVHRHLNCNPWYAPRDICPCPIQSFPYSPSVVKTSIHPSLVTSIERDASQPTSWLYASCSRMEGWWSFSIGFSGKHGIVEYCDSVGTNLGWYRTVHATWSDCFRRY